MRFIDWLFLYLRYSRPLRSRLFFFSFLHMLLLLLVSWMDIIIARQKRKMYKIWSTTTPYTPIDRPGTSRTICRASILLFPPIHLICFFFHPREDGKKIFWKLHPADYLLDAFKSAMANFVSSSREGGGHAELILTVRYYYYDYYMDGRIGWLRI